MLLNGGGSMRYVIAVFSVCFVLSIVSVLGAADQVDYLCKMECVQKGLTAGQCNSVCAMKGNSESECVSTCLKEKGWTRHNCYRECGDEKGDTKGPEQSPR